MKAWRAQQQWKRKTMARNCGGSIWLNENCAGHCNCSRGHHTWYCTKALSIGDAARFEYRRWVVDDGDPSSFHQAICCVKCRRTEVGLSDCIENQLMSWQWDRRVEKVHDDHRSHKDSIV